MSPLIIALDFARVEQVWSLIDRLDAKQCRLKVGKELFTRGGPVLVEQLQARGFEIFLDLKFHDIPHTVAQAVSAAADLGVWMVNVHASGGRRMMEAAVTALAEYQKRPHLIAVTVLTSMEDADLHEVGMTMDSDAQVRLLADLAMSCGLDGVVCSGHEVSALRHVHPGSLFVTPGIRPAGSSADDQRRTLTPRLAMQAGATHLVVGRPVTRAADPAAALSGLLLDLASSD
ncbi:MAG: orotidine-5'-phosphate decarboxylase [Pseudomonadales bacterium]|nr:orotidine-5'-phosphate decarboxylase [Pseudomonadales bacterium]